MTLFFTLSSQASSNYKVGQLKKSSVLTALAYKEAKRFTSSSVYMINMGMGLILALIASVASAFLGVDKLISNVDGVNAKDMAALLPVISNVVPFGISMVVNMCNTCAVSCEDCLRRKTFICRDCGDRHWNDDSADGDLCQTCYDEDYVRCERCDAVIHYDDACYHEDEEYHDHPYCRDCFDMDEIIHDYYYKPEPIFYGDGPRYLGVELELDDGGENEFCASKLLEIANNGCERMYIKHDEIGRAHV